MGGCASRDVPTDDVEEYEVPIQESSGDTGTVQCVLLTS